MSSKAPSSIPKAENHKQEDEQEGYHSRRLSSDQTLHSLRRGFFKDYLDQVDFHLPQDFIDDFGSCKTDHERFTRMWNFKLVHQILQQVNMSRKEKDRSASERLRNDGNKAFRENRDAEALSLYSEALRLAPSDDGDCLSLSYANRSAVFYHRGDYQLCLNDIRLAIDSGYPKKLMYKILDRRGQSLLKLGKHSQATAAFREAIETLTASEVENKKLLNLQMDFEDKIKLCDGKADDEVRQEANDKKSPVRVYGKPNPYLPSASSAFGVQHSKSQGRYAVAETAVPTGQILLTERPYATAMIPDRISTHCFSCFTWLTAPVACPWCSRVAFCSEGCRDLAIATHHKWECKILQTLEDSGMSLNCFFALRIIAQHGLRFFKKIQPRLQEPAAKLPSASSPYYPNDYLNIYHLARLESLRAQNNFIPLAVMAVFLLKMLQRVNFFGNWQEKDSTDRDLSEDEALIGRLLLRHLQVVQFNAHEVSGMEFKTEERRFEESKSVFLGLGVYPTAALCNHECYPTVTRYFEGTKLVLVSLRPLSPGDLIAENYGPVFTKEELLQRQKKLSSFYWFKCSCNACVCNWPVYSKMKLTKSFSCQKCRASLPARTQKQSHVTCKECGTSQNANDMFKKLEETQKQFEEGKDNLARGNREEAIISFVKYVNSVYRLVCLPTYELFLAFDCLRLALAARSTIQLVRNDMT